MEDLSKLTVANLKKEIQKREKDINVSDSFQKILKLGLTKKS